MAQPIDPDQSQQELTSDPRRAATRVAGPFDGRWVGALTLPLRIHDLSEGGCLIQAYHDQPPGQRFKLEIELPYEGWLSFEAETLYIRGGVGFAVKFIDVPSETQARLESVVHRLATKSPSEL
ncbi:MAG: PilZ domain-containing protein [Vicinamibacterales bacterium]